jgi:hypothetical protein
MNKKTEEVEAYLAHQVASTSSVLCKLNVYLSRSLLYSRHPYLQ